MKPQGLGARLVNGALDALSALPYFRGKGTLALGALRVCGNGARLTGRLPSGGRVLIGPDATHQTILPYWIGKHETGVVQTLTQSAARLPPKTAAMDIGSNLGFYTVLLAAEMRRNGSGVVYSFEPNPPIFAELRENVALNGFANVILENLGLGDVNAKLPLYVKDYSPTVSSLRDMQGTLDAQITIQVTTLDDYVAKQRIEKVGLVKMDVEGSELLIMRGGQQLLKREPDRFWCEEFESAYQEFGYSIRDLRAFLAALGYRLYAIPENKTGGSALRELSVNNAEGMMYQNVLAKPSGV